MGERIMGGCDLFLSDFHGRFLAACQGGELVL